MLCYHLGQSPVDLTQSLRKTLFAGVDTAAGHMDALAAVTVDDAVAGDPGTGINAQDTAFGWLVWLRSQFQIL
jgi:hypothetical protein